MAGVSPAEQAGLSMGFACGYQPGKETGAIAAPEYISTSARVFACHFGLGTLCELVYLSEPCIPGKRCARSTSNEDNTRFKDNWFVETGNIYLCRQTIYRYRSCQCRKMQAGSVF